MDRAKPAMGTADGSIDTLDTRESGVPEHEQVGGPPTAGTRKPPSYIAAQLMTDPESVYNWAYGVEPDED